MVGPARMPATVEQLEATGALLYIGMLLGPALAGLIVTGLVSGRAGLRDLLSRSLKWRVGAWWYAAALLLIPLLAAMSSGCCGVTASRPRLWGWALWGHPPAPDPFGPLLPQV